MREAQFIKKNKDRWIKNQQLPPDDPDEMAKDFTQLVDDLAYAKTFYPTSSVTGYINSQASKIYLDIYKNRKEDSNRLFTFWKYDLPLTIRKHYVSLLFSLALFIIFFSVGFFISQHDEAGARLILGDGYVEKTINNIEKGNPFGIYESGTAFLTWMWIMINNIRVALTIYASGIFFAIPSLYIHVQNSVIIGSFDQLFVSKGLGIDFFLVVFVHGTLEITALILTTGAAIVLGKGFIFPGTISRLQSLKIAAKESVKIMIGLIPVFALAAFFEGFITRLYNDVSIFTSFITAISVIFVIWYFIVYPIRLGRIRKAELNEVAL